jgi:hypothetical protein
MPGVGDRVVFEGSKVGGSRREGQLLSIDGRAVRVRWDDGSDSLLIPGPGAMRVVATARSPKSGTAKTAKAAVAPVKKKPAPAKSQKKAVASKKKR